jgi:hypothetical protein
MGRSVFYLSENSNDGAVGVFWASGRKDWPCGWRHWDFYLVQPWITKSKESKTNRSREPDEWSSVRASCRPQTGAAPSSIFKSLFHGLTALKFQFLDTVHPIFPPPKNKTHNNSWSKRKYETQLLSPSLAMWHWDTAYFYSKCSSTSTFINLFTIYSSNIYWKCRTSYLIAC